MADTGITPAAGGAAGTGPAGAAGSAAGRCYWRFADFDNLVEDTDKFQGYGEVNFTFHDGIKFHLEGLYGQTNVHNVPGSVSYLPAQNPGPFGLTPPGFTPGTGPASGNGDSKRVAGTGFTAGQLAAALGSANFYIPIQNPGLMAIRSLAGAAALSADAAGAARLLGAGQLDRGVLGWTRDLQEQSRCNQTIARILGLGLDEDRLAALMAEGRSWSLERAIDEALSASLPA